MRPSRFTLLFLSLLFLFAVSGFAQTAADNAIAHAAVANSQAGLGSDIGPVNVNSGYPGMLTIGSNVVLDADTGAVVSGASGNAGLNNNAKSNLVGGGGSNSNLAAPDQRPNLPTIDGLNTIATFDGAFVAQAGPSSGRDFRFTMVGNDPKLGGTTVYPGNISEVDLQLLNADGSVFKVVPFAPFENLFLQSPNFVGLDYRSGHSVEFGDAVHRAQFFNVMKNNWHTVIVPKVVDHVTITVPFFVNVQLSNGTVIQARSYFTGTAADGNTFVLMLSPLFNFFFDNEVVNEINLGNFTTDGMNMSLFPNTFLFNLNVNNPNTPGGCCVLGFHTFFLDGGFPEDRWITQYASWISPGLFGAGFEDVTALSHELAESFANPFVSNPAPNWQFPGEPPTAKVCQANLEEGDPIEVLANATAPITVTEKNFTFTYHPQNIPLLQWFEMGAKSSAIDGAFSFPDETVLPHSALPCPQ
ncbi:MAG TPA: hypothetical protein VJV96_09120 [Candidatus Angelobacter sp.]|nr:hypothetical protein [Candidatus Angelobacter sp.]